jgi:hypothetical protein
MSLAKLYSKREIPSSFLAPGLVAEGGKALFHSRRSALMGQCQARQHIEREKSDLAWHATHFKTNCHSKPPRSLPLTCSHQTHPCGSQDQLEGDDTPTLGLILPDSLERDSGRRRGNENFAATAAMLKQILGARAIETLTIIY